MRRTPGRAVTPVADSQLNEAVAATRLSQASHPASDAAPAATTVKVRPRLGLVLGLGLLFVGGAGALYAIRRPATVPPAGRAPEPTMAASAPAPPPVPPPQPEPALAHVLLRSDPAGATVVDESTGRAVGVTPLTIERPVGTLDVQVRLSLDGHESAVRTLTFAGDASLDVPLAKSKARRPRATRSNDEPAKL